MGYCTYGGKVVPGNNQAGCVGGGGNWVEDQPAMNINPNEQARLVAERQMQEWEGGGLTSELIPGESLISDGLIAGSNAIGLPPEAGLIAGGLFTKNPKQFVKGLTKNPKQTVKEFTGTPNTIKQVSQNTTKPNIFRGPPQQKLSDIGKIDPNAYKNSKAYKLDNYVFNNPIKSAAGAASVGVPAYNMFNSEEPITDKKVVQNTIVNQTSPGFTKEQLNARDKAIMQAQNAGNTEGVNALLAGGNPADVTKPDTQLGGKDSMGRLGGATTSDYTEVPDDVEDENTPDDKNSITSGLSDLWGNMQKPGYWSEQVEGGAGKWDNRLFRLGEMMSHMGTPLSKRGKNPADRWTNASKSANTLKAASVKAAGSTADFWKNVSASDMNETTLLKLFTPDKGGFFGDSKIEAGQKGAARVAAYVSKRSELIQGGTVPTHQEVMDALSGKKKDK